MFTKTFSALAIIAFGQINFLIQSHGFLLEKIKEVSYKIAQNTHWPKDEKDNKKFSTNPQKQFSTRIRQSKKLDLQKILLLSERLEDGQILIAKVNIFAKHEVLVVNDFNVEKLVLFGCCTNRTLLS